MSTSSGKPLSNSASGPKMWYMEPQNVNVVLTLCSAAVERSLGRAAMADRKVDTTLQ